MFELNKTYNFTTLSPAILGANFTQAKVLGIMTAAQAIAIQDVATIHSSVYPTLSPSTDRDYTKLTYVLFDINGETLLLANEWIVPSSIELTVTTVATITVRDISSQDLLNIRASLTALGYHNFDITQT